MKKLNILVVSLLLVGCDSSSDKLKGTWENIYAKEIITVGNFKVNPFNTAMSLKYFVNEEVENKGQLISDVKEIYQTNIETLHKKFDRHYSYYLDQHNQNLGEYTNIKDINDSLDSGNYVKLDQETYDLLKMGVECSKYSEGYFNIFIGKVTDFWDEVFYEAYNFSDISLDPYFNEERKELLSSLINSIPNTNAEIDNVLEFKDDTLEVRFNSLKDDEGKSLGKISISVGGIAKGYATDLVKEKLIAKGYNQGYLFSGGSSVSSLSTPIYNNEKGQYISVVDPRSAHLFGEDKKSAFGVYLNDEFNMSTSGNYTSGKSYTFLNDSNKRVTRHHIINSFTGYPEYESGVASVTVISKKLSAGVLDAFSTTLVNKSIEDGLLFRRKVMDDYQADLEIVYIVENIEDNTIEIITTSDFNKTFEKGSQKGISVRYE